MMPITIIVTHVVIIEEKQVIKTKRNVYTNTAIKNQVNAINVAMAMAVCRCMRWWRMSMMSFITFMAS